MGDTSFRSSKPHRICPWWLIPTFDNPLRRLLHKPEVMLAGLVREGQTAIDVGCGIGYFTIPLARLAGPAGRVIAVDLQQRMLRGVRQRARRAGLEGRIRLHRCTAEGLGLSEPTDFILAFWMIHEVPDQASLLKQIRDLLKPGGRFLLVEPKLHVTATAFAKTMGHAEASGLKPCAEPRVALSWAVLFSP